MRDGANGGNVLDGASSVLVGMEMVGDGQLQAFAAESDAMRLPHALSVSQPSSSSLSRPFQVQVQIHVHAVCALNATKDSPILIITAWFHHGGDSSGCSKAVLLQLGPRGDEGNIPAGSD